MYCHKKLLIGLQALLGATVCFSQAQKPIRALLITGGCCHDYAHQKTILTEGISDRANVVWSIVHEGDGTTDHKISVYEDPNWAQNFDVVVHDECFSDVKDAAFVRGILKPHLNGLPAVNLHCAMHCYRVDFDSFRDWFQFTGLDSRAHGALLPISVNFVPNAGLITQGFTNWTTVPEELYNNIHIEKTVTPMIYGNQGESTNLVAWMNDYHGTRVFSTTLGHTTTTVSDPRYLDLVTRGLLWSVNRLNPDYLKPAARKPKKMVMVPVNLAQNKTALASAAQDGHPAEHATDGDPDTRWCAPDDKGGYWWQVDLGKPQEVAGCRISWEKENGPYHYVISGSTDGKTWTTLREEKSTPRPQTDEQKFSDPAVRYVRITINQAGPGAWASFYEFEVFGKAMVPKPFSQISDPRMAAVQSPAGFEHALFAAPPNISYPTCLEATPFGDVFVGVDQNGSIDHQANRGWVIRCRDTKGEGSADDFKVFAKMDSPRGMVFSRNTLYVMHPPVLEAFHDDDGDGIADHSEILVRGLTTDLTSRGADHTCNGVRLGIDGFLYVALGDYGALNAVAKDGSHVQLHGGGILRVRPDGSQLSVVVQGTRNIYDVAIDPFMNLFTCDNTNDGDGWNVRLSHMIPTANYGYPSLYKNFSKELMPTIQDYGGGSPTGALFVDEPGMPEGFGSGLYTCQWGWNTVNRHPLTKTGATFSADKQTFVRVTRPTGIASDGLGNMYIASWKGATFSYEGPNVGFVMRVSPVNYQAAPMPDVKTLSQAQLLEILVSSSAVRRLHAQRELLSRPPFKTLAAELTKNAASSKPIAARAACVFTLGQLRDAASLKALVNLCGNPELRPCALRALTDSPQAAKLPADFFAQFLQDHDPAVRLQAIVSLNQLHRTETARQLVPFLNDSDPAIAQVAFRALVSFQADQVCFDEVDKVSPLAENALRVLGNLHEPAVVDGLIAHLEKPGITPAIKAGLLETLCRLYFREADWDGSWWSTRPDTTGPYYKAIAWDQTERIADCLERCRMRNDQTEIRQVELLFQKYKIQAAKPAVVKFNANAGEATNGLVSNSLTTSNTVATLAYEELVKRVAATIGTATTGARLFETVGCNNCHTVSAKEPPKGPFLGDIAARYNQSEIIESIVRPNAKIAQGFETATVETKEGENYDGFIVRESGDEIELRNLRGAIVIPKSKIAARGNRKLSIMPEGLVNALTPEELSSLVAYLQSLKAKT